MPNWTGVAVAVTTFNATLILAEGIYIIPIAD